MSKEKEVKKILVSACLLGDNCKYDGGNNYNKELVEWLSDKIVIKVCPEMLGGLGTPRIPCEIKGDKVINKNGEDKSYFFTKGALETVKIALENQVHFAILKSNSPSCGSDMVYDGSFANRLVPGEGITAHHLKLNGIKVYAENDLEEIKKIY